MMKRVFAYLTVLVLSLTLMPGAVTTVLAGEKQDDIVALIQVTGTMDVMDQLIDAQVPELMGAIRAMGLDAPPSFFEDFEGVAVQEFKNSKPEFMRAIIAIYDTNFTHQEIREVAAFYRSSTGRKIIATTPQVVQQSLAVGQAWGAEISQRVIELLRTELAPVHYTY